MPLNFFTSQMIDVMICRVVPNKRGRNFALQLCGALVSGLALSALTSGSQTLHMGVCQVSYTGFRSTMWASGIENVVVDQRETTQLTTTTTTVEHYRACASVCRKDSEKVRSDIHRRWKKYRWQQWKRRTLFSKSVDTSGRTSCSHEAHSALFGFETMVCKPEVRKSTPAYIRSSCSTTSTKHR